jgi:hypothetical protein
METCWCLGTRHEMENPPRFYTKSQALADVKAMTGYFDEVLDLIEGSHHMSVNMTKTPMVDLQKQAKISLAKHGVEADGKGGVKVRLVLDHSGSMYRWYEAGAVQRLTEQVLGLAAALDDDGTIETWYFGSRISSAYEVSLNPTASGEKAKRRRWGRRPTVSELDPYYVGWVDRSHPLQPWGSTNYEVALKAPVDFQQNSEEDEPALVIFQTDGGPDSAIKARDMIRALSGEKTFFAFVVFGNDRGARDFMEDLDTMTGRTRDNVSAFFTGDLDNYATLPDSEVYDGVLTEFVKKWLPEVL